jgi:branched-chain amino acid transport system substrate-binding protein
MRAMLKTQNRVSLIRSFFPPRMLLAAGLALVLGVCGLGSPVMAQDEFKYGAIMPMTGPIAQYGQYFLHASQMALEDIEKSGWINGKKIRIVLEDGKNDPKVSLAAMNKAVSIDKVPIVESMGSSVMMALGPVAKDNGVVLVNSAAQSPLLRKLGSFFFSLQPLSDQMLPNVVEHAVNVLKAKKVAIAQVNNEFGKGLADNFTQLFEKQGGKIVLTEIFALGETDFTTHITKLKFSSADLFFIVGHENEIGYFLKKAKQMGVKTQILAPPGLLIPLTFQIAGNEAIEGAMTGDFAFDPENGTEKMKAFGKRYKDKYGSIPINLEANTYDSIMMYASALRKGCRTGAEIKDYYHGLKNYEGIAQAVTFDKDGITMQGSVIREARGGKLVPLKK